MEQIDKACGEKDSERRQADERVAIFAPARNIETWLAYLAGKNVNETDRYPRLIRERDCQDQTQRLYEMCQQGAMEGTPPSSLVAACAEYRTRLQ